MCRKEDKKELDITLGGVSCAGILALFQLEEDYAGRSIPITYHDVTDEIIGILHLLKKNAHHILPLVQRKTPSIFEQAGESIRLIFDIFPDYEFYGQAYHSSDEQLIQPSPGPLERCSLLYEAGRCGWTSYHGV